MRKVFYLLSVFIVLSNKDSGIHTGLDAPLPPERLNQSLKAKGNFKVAASTSVP